MSEGAVRWFRLAVTVALAGFVIISVAIAPPQAEDRARLIGEQIKCPVCSGESIADSPAPLARDMMVYVDELVDAGYTDEQVIEEVLGAYGSDAQRLDPVFSLSTLALWLVPALVLGGGAMAALARRRPNAVTATDAPR